MGYSNKQVEVPPEYKALSSVHFGLESCLCGVRTSTPILDVLNVSVI